MATHSSILAWGIPQTEEPIKATVGKSQTRLRSEINTTTTTANEGFSALALLMFWTGSFFAEWGVCVWSPFLCIVGCLGATLACTHWQCNPLSHV